MARIRTIKPEFFTSLTVADLTPEQRLTFIGLWTHADDEGRCVDDPRLIKAAVWPLDDRTAADIEVDLKALSESSLITRYTLNRKRYLAVASWHEHQRINRPTESKLPAPEEGDPPDPEPPTSDDSDSSTPHGELTEPSPPERKGTGNREQGTGKGSLPDDTLDSPDARVAEEPIPERMFQEWWRRHGRRTAQSKHSVRSTIAEALSNGLDPDELWAALGRLAETNHPVTGGCLQVALADVRKRASPALPAVGDNVVPISGARTSGTDANFAGHAALTAALRAEETRETS